MKNEHELEKKQIRMHHQTIQDIFADENGEWMKKLTVEGHKKTLVYNKTWQEHKIFFILTSKYTTEGIHMKEQNVPFLKLCRSVQGDTFNLNRAD